MWIYEKKLEFPVKIRNSNPQAAKIIISQLGGPDGETGAATRYLNQRYSMPNRRVIGILTDVGTEAPVMYRLYYYNKAIGHFLSFVISNFNLHQVHSMSLFNL